MPFGVMLAAADPAEGRRWLNILKPLSDSLVVEGVYSSGAELLLHSRHSIPDIIITDMLLSDTSALSVIRTLRQGDFPFRVIVVSREKNFEDAYIAILHHVDGFLLSPVEDNELLRIVRELLRSLEMQRTVLPLMEYRKVIGRLFLDRARIALQDNRFPVEIVNSLYDTQFRDDAYRMVVILMDKTEQVPYAQLKKLLDIAATSFYAEAISHCYEIVMRFAHKRVHILLNYASAQEHEIASLLEQQLRHIVQSLPVGITVNFCCSSQHDSIQDIGLMAEESMDAAWARFSRQAGTILIEADNTSCSPQILQLYKEAEQDLNRACYELNLPAFEGRLQQLLSLPRYIISCRETRHLMRRVEAYMVETNRDLISTFANVELVKQDIRKTLQMANTLEEYTQKYSECLVSLLRQILEQIGGRQSKHIRLAKQYIGQHLGEPIYLQDVANWVGLSPVYLSSLFKKETGKNFSDYVNECRVDAAKRMLAEDGMKIQTIARSLSYYDSRHFSRVFKELTGMKPTEYRAAVHEKEIAGRDESEKGQ